jgi:hypothetical protein
MTYGFSHLQSVRLNTIDQEDFRHKEPIEPFVEPWIWYHCWVTTGALDTTHIRQEQPHKRERHHTFSNNLKIIGLWVISLIKCSTSIILIEVGFLTHTCYTTECPICWSHNVSQLITNYNEPPYLSLVLIIALHNC